MSVVQTLLEHQQAWGHDHFPGELIPVLNHLLIEELFSNFQSDLPLTELYAIPLDHINGHMKLLLLKSRVFVLLLVSSVHSRILNSTMS